MTHPAVPDRHTHHSDDPREITLPETGTRVVVVRDPNAIGGWRVTDVLEPVAEIRTRPHTGARLYGGEVTDPAMIAAIRERVGK